MASTTRSSARPEARRRARLAACALLAIAAGAALPVGADELRVARVETHRSQDFILVDADLDIDISPDAREALESGVALTFVVEFQVRRARRYLWDPTVIEQARHIRVQRHALADRYLVTDLVRDQRHVFNSVGEALNAVGTLRDIPLGRPAELPMPGAYIARLRARLDIESLPAPLRPIAYISPSWRLGSDWYEWNFAP